MESDPCDTYPTSHPSVHDDPLVMLPPHPPIAKFDTSVGFVQGLGSHVPATALNSPAKHVMTMFPIAVYLLSHPTVQVPLLFVNEAQLDVVKGGESDGRRHGSGLHVPLMALNVPAKQEMFIDP